MGGGAYDMMGGAGASATLNGSPVSTVAPPSTSDVLSAIGSGVGQAGQSAKSGQTPVSGTINPGGPIPQAAPLNAAAFFQNQQNPSQMFAQLLGEFMQRNGQPFQL